MRGRSWDDNMSKLKAIILKLMDENPSLRRTRSTSCTGSESAHGSSSKHVAGNRDTGDTSKRGGDDKPLEEHDAQHEKTCKDEGTLVFNYAPQDFWLPTCCQNMPKYGILLWMLKIRIPPFFLFWWVPFLDISHDYAYIYNVRKHSNMSFKPCL